MQSKRNREKNKPYLLDEMPLKFMLNLALWTRRLFDTQSWLRLFIHVFPGLTGIEVNCSVTSAAYYTYRVLLPFYFRLLDSFPVVFFLLHIT